MYLLRYQRILPDDGIDDYIARVRTASDVTFDIGAHREVVILRSLGYPELFTTLIQYESDESARAVFQSREMQSLRESQPIEVMGMLVGLEEAYTLVHGTTNTAITPTIAVLNYWTLEFDPSIPRRFEDDGAELHHLRAEYGHGVGTQRLYRSMGNPLKYLVIAQYTNRSDFQSTHAEGRVAAFMDESPPTVYTRQTPDIEVCEVIGRF